MTTVQKLTPAQSESTLTSDNVRKGINITTGGHRREQRRRRCLLNLLLVAATIVCINAAVTTLLISWRTPTVVSFDMKKTLDQFTEQASAQSLDEAQTKALTERFMTSLNAELQDWQRRHDALILVTPAVVSGRATSLMRFRPGWHTEWRREAATDEKGAAGTVADFRRSTGKKSGDMGEMYPIAEQDMLTTIQTRLKAMEASGEMAREQEAFKQRVIENTLRPRPVEGLTLAQENTTHYIDPSLTVSEDLKDHQGRVFARKGQVINPLDTVPFTDTLYFIDADNPQQLAWMKAQKPGTLTYRVILVNGDVREATNALNTRIYFDQDGSLCRKFKLKAIPARVTLAEDRRRLRVDTFALDAPEVKP